MVKDTTLDIFCNIRSGEILIQPSMYGEIDTVTGWFARGSFLRFKLEDFKEKGWDIILNLIENLSVFDPNAKSELEAMNKSQLRKFYANHKCVGLDFSKSGEIHLIPMNKVNKTGGMAGEEKIPLSSSITNHQFWEKLSEAFRKSN